MRWRAISLALALAARRASASAPQACDVTAPENGSLGNCPASLTSANECQPDCNQGYSVVGVTKCTDGQLAKTTCEPKSCSIAAPPTNGESGNCESTLNSGDSCKPACKEGYQRHGTTTCNLGVLHAATCNPKSCDASANPENGVNGDCTANLASSSTCQPKCNAGYTHSGPSSCLNGQLTAATCHPSPCNAAVDPQNGDKGDCTDSLATGNTCVPKCNEGYQLVGVTECHLGALTVATCRPASCDAFVAPDHGKVGTCTATLASGSSCQPECDEGFTASGESTCLNGQLTKAVCVGSPCDASSVTPNGELGTCTSVLASGKTCQPECHEGYTVTGPSSCNNGMLTEATCRATPCDASANPVNGLANDCTGSLLSGSSCQYVCNSGYTVSGATKCSLGKLTPATCDPSPCNTSIPPANAKVGDCPNGLLSGLSCKPECDHGYTRKGESKCLLGVLTAAICEPSACDASIAPANGLAGSCSENGGLLAHGSTCLPVCNEGYTVSGASTCHLGDLSPANCKPSPCDASQAPENGGVGDCTSVLESGKTCKPSCERGYTRNAPTSCSYGKMTSATCGPSPCDASHAPENGEVGDCPSSLASGEKCQPKCNSGFHPSGRSTCSMGTLAAATCLVGDPTACDASAAPSHGGVGNCTDKLTPGSSCTPTCDAGYMLSGLTTCVHGIFEAATCKERVCDASAAPLNGAVGDCTAALGNGQTCQPSCNTGFKVSGVTSCTNYDLQPAKCSPIVAATVQQPAVQQPSVQQPAVQQRAVQQPVVQQQRTVPQAAVQPPTLPQVAVQQPQTVEEEEDWTWLWWVLAGLGLFALFACILLCCFYMQKASPGRKRALKMSVDSPKVAPLSSATYQTLEDRNVSQVYTTTYTQAQPSTVYAAQPSYQSVRVEPTFQAVPTYAAQPSYQSQRVEATYQSPNSSYAPPSASYVAPPAYQALQQNSPVQTGYATPTYQSFAADPYTSMGGSASTVPYGTPQVNREVTPYR